MSHQKLAWIPEEYVSTEDEQQSVAQVSLVLDGNQHIGRYLAGEVVEKSSKWGAEHLDDFLPGSKHLSLQERLFHVGRSSPRYLRKLPITKENTYLHVGRKRKRGKKKGREGTNLASRPKQLYSFS